MISIIPKRQIDNHDIKILRHISSLSIAEIKLASREQTPIRTFEIFGNDWDNQRKELLDIYKLYLSNNPPFIIIDSEDQINPLSPTKLKLKLEFWRSIEIDTQMNSDLEMGYINNPADFEQHDEDWTKQ